MPDDEKGVTESLEWLFEIGQTRANVMILLEGGWNIKRGRSPYFDYVPHFLDGLFDGEFGNYAEDGIKEWISRENLQVFFDEEVVPRDIRSYWNGKPSQT